MVSLNLFLCPWHFMYVGFKRLDYGSGLFLWKEYVCLLPSEKNVFGCCYDVRGADIIATIQYFIIVYMF